MGEKLYLECSCSSKDHVVCITLNDYNQEGENDVDELWFSIDTQMSHHLGFFKRIWAALRYVFKGTPCEYGKWNETIVDPDQAEKLKVLIDIYLDRISQLKNR